MTNENRLRRVDILVGLSLVSILTISIGAWIDDPSLIVFGAAVGAGVIAGTLP